jgi:hypothetical protein
MATGATSSHGLIEDCRSRVELFVERTAGFRGLWKHHRRLARQHSCLVEALGRDRHETHNPSVTGRISPPITVRVVDPRHGQQSADFRPVASLDLTSRFLDKMPGWSSCDLTDASSHARQRWRGCAGQPYLRSQAQPRRGFEPSAARAVLAGGRYRPGARRTGRSSRLWTGHPRRRVGIRSAQGEVYFDKHPKATARYESRVDPVASPGPRCASPGTEAASGVAGVLSSPSPRVCGRCRCRR